MKKVQLVIVGAGPGGYVCAIRAAQLGIKTLLIEKEHVGGVCLNWGCIPSKTLITASNLFHRIKGATKFGIQVEKASIHWPDLHKHKSDVVKKLGSGVGQLLKANKVEQMSGDATFEHAKSIRVTTQDGSHENIEFDYAVIATGSSPIELPQFPIDGKSIVHSKHIFDIAQIPKHLIVLGGGVIGLELAFVFKRLGSQVSVVEMLPAVLPGQDKDIVQAMTKVLRKEEIQLFTDTQAIGCERKNGKIILQAKRGSESQSLEGDLLLMAIGMRPNTKNLGLDKAQVKLTDKGFIQCNSKLQTSQPHIYAIGDVAGPPLLAHKASHQGLFVASQIKGSRENYEPLSIPGAIFTDPEIASVGLTEDEARKKHGELKIGIFPFAALGKAIAMNETEGFCKVITEAKSKRIVGVHMIGPEVSNLISEASLSLEVQAIADDVTMTMHPHPTLSEAFLEACEAAMGHAVHMVNR